MQITNLKWFRIYDKHALSHLTAWTWQQERHIWSKEQLNNNKHQSNLAKGDITPLLLICSITFTRWQHASQSWSMAMGCFWDPHFGGRRGRRGSATVPFETVMVVSYRLSVVTTRPQFLRCSNQQGVGHFGAKFEEEGV